MLASRRHPLRLEHCEHHSNSEKTRTIDPLLYYIGSARSLFQKICDKQLGFRKNRSIECQLALVVERLQRTLTDGGQVDAISMDLSKAFDKVCRTLLTSKLQNLGAQDYIVRFLSVSLSCRQQRTIIDSSPSSLKPVTSGVPQGSSLGPLLFLVFINDLPAHCTSVICLFSDHSVPHRRFHSPEDTLALQTELARINEWSMNNRMQFKGLHPTVVTFKLKKKPVMHGYGVS